MAETQTRLQRQLDRRTKALGLSWRELSTSAGLNESAVKSIMRGDSKSPRHATLQALAKRLGCTVADLTEDTATDVNITSDLPTSEIHRSSEARTIEVAGEEYTFIPAFDLRLSAGPGAWVDDYPEPQYFEPYRSQWIRSITAAQPNALIIARVSGDSMWETLHDGDNVLVDRTKTRANRDGLYAFLYDGEIMVKRVSVDMVTKLLTISSDNQRYRALEGVNPEDVKIIGRVVWLGRQV